MIKKVEETKKFLKEQIYCDVCGKLLEEQSCSEKNGILNLETYMNCCLEARYRKPIIVDFPGYHSYKERARYTVEKDLCEDCYNKITEKVTKFLGEL